MILQMEANIQLTLKMSLFRHFMMLSFKVQSVTFTEPVRAAMLAVLMSVCGVYWAIVVSLHYIIEVERQGKPPFIYS